MKYLKYYKKSLKIFKQKSKLYKNINNKQSTNVTLNDTKI